MRKWAFLASLDKLATSNVALYALHSAIQVEVLMGQGMSRLDAIRQIGVVEQTYYRWRKQYGGMGVDQLKQLKRLQKENEHLRRAVSDLTLDKLILKEAARGNF